MTELHAARAYYLDGGDHFKAVEVIVYAEGYDACTAVNIIDFPHESLLSREQTERHLRYCIEASKPKPDAGALCANCMDPGHCCKVFMLNRPFPFGTPRSMVAAVIKDMVGVPFTPLNQTSTPPHLSAQGKTYWNFSCPNLLPSGRCGIYEKRPEFCRSFEPGSTPLCVHYRPRTEPVADADVEKVAE